MLVDQRALQRSAGSTAARRRVPARFSRADECERILPDFAVFRQGQLHPKYARQIVIFGVWEAALALDAMKKAPIPDAYLCKGRRVGWLAQPQQVIGLRTLKRGDGAARDHRLLGSLASGRCLQGRDAKMLLWPAIL